MSKTGLAKRGGIPVFCLTAPGFLKNADKTLYSERTVPNKNKNTRFRGEDAPHERIQFRRGGLFSFAPGGAPEPERTALHRAV